MPTTVSDIPSDKVGQEVQQLVHAGSSKITCTKQPDGKWTISVE